MTNQGDNMTKTEKTNKAKMKAMYALYNNGKPKSKCPNCKLLLVQKTKTGEKCICCDYKK